MLEIDIVAVPRILINHEVSLNSNSQLENIFLDCEIPVINKDEPSEPDRAIIVQIEPEKRPYQYSPSEEDSAMVKSSDFDYFVNDRPNQIDPVSIPKPGYNLSHCKERDVT